MGQLCFSKGFSVYLTRYRENAGHTIPHSPFPMYWLCSSIGLEY